MCEVYACVNIGSIVSHKEKSVDNFHSKTDRPCTYICRDREKGN